MRLDLVVISYKDKGDKLDFIAIKNFYKSKSSTE